MARFWSMEFLGILVALATCIATVCCFETDSPLKVLRLLHMEEEMIDFSHFVIEQDKKFHKTDNVELLHSFGEYLSFLKKAKYANALSFNDTEAIQRDPVAIFHLKKRLTDKWLPHFLLLKESEIVSKNAALTRNMDSMVSVIESECEPKLAIENILRLKDIYNIPVLSIIEGKIDPRYPTNPIHAQDIAEISDYVATRDCAKDALEWLEHAMRRTDKKSEMYLKMLSKKGRLLLHEGEMHQAMEIFEQLMKLEPKKRSHQSSYDYARMKINSTINTDETDKNVTSIFWHNVCNGRYQPNPERLQNLKCYELEVEDHIPTIQIEELHLSPRVVMVRNLFHPAVLEDVLENYSKEMLTKMMGDIYNVGIRTKTAPGRYSKKLNITPIYDTICNVTFHDTQLKLIDSVVPIALTEEGPGGNADNVILYQTYVMQSIWQTLHMAHYQIFLSDVEQGGGIAFPQFRLHIKPEKGAAVFWSFKTRRGPVHPGFREVVTCPPLIGTQWMAKATISHNFVYDRVDL